MRDSVRLLGKTGGYTAEPSHALREEPEAVDRETQRRITLAAAESWPHLNALQQAERASAPLHRRIARAKAQARHAGVNVHNELRLVRLAIEGGRSYAHVDRRLSVVEERLWPR